MKAEVKVGASNDAGMFEKFVSKYRSRKYFFKLVLSFLTVSIFMIAIFALVTYIGAKSTVKKQINISNKLYLEQTVIAIETVMDQIYEVSKNIAHDKTFDDYNTFSQSMYYENLEGSFKEHDLIFLAEYLEVKKNLINRISMQRVINNFIESVYYYNIKNDIVITSDGFLYAFSEFHDKSWFDMVNQAVPSNSAIIQRPYQGIAGDIKISVIYRFVNGDVFVIDLNKEYLYNSIIKRIEEKNVVIVLSDKGENVFTVGSQAQITGDDTSKILIEALENGQENFSITYDNKKYLCTGIYSQRLGWNFYILTDAENLYLTIGYLGLIFIIAFILLAILGTVSSMFSSSRLYKPLRTLLGKLKDIGFKQPVMEGSKTSEWEYMEDSLNELYEEKKDILKKLDESIPAYRDKFLASLLKGQIDSEESITDKLSYFKINLSRENISVLIIEASYINNVSKDEFAINIESVFIRELIERELDGYQNVLLEISEKKYVVMINTDDSGFNDLYELVRKIKRKVERINNIVCTIGIGRRYPTIRYIEKSFREAMEALKFKTAIGHDEIIYIDDVMIKPSRKLEFSEEDENELKNSIKTGDYISSEEILRNIIEKLYNKHGRIDYIQTQHIYFRILSLIIESISEIGIDIYDIYDDSIEIYSELSSVSNSKRTENILDWFFKLLDKITGYIRKQVNDKDSRHIKQIRDIIENCNESNVQFLSLTYIADMMALNPAYLSRIFKKNTNMNLSEFILSYKIKTAKRLLEETNLSISEIGSRCGYNSYDYFINIFKDSAGTTPGAYRKMANK